MLAGCFGAGQELEGLNLRVPELDSEVSTPCVVPEMARNAKVAALQQQNALYKCKGKHGKAVDAYGRVRDAYSGKGRKATQP